MSSFRCLLLLAGQELPVVHCAYQFSQPTAQRGRVAAKVRSGLITLELDVPHDDQLLAWATDPQKKLGGTLLFLETNRPTFSEQLEFEDAFCVSYQEDFRSGAESAGAYRCTLQLSAAKLVLGTVERDSTWAQTR
ncbi:hypothetical protein GCM10022409_09240 [Hymenobacter glaciei]|uniref:Immunoglobulin V-set domain-containing protein n=1 Tax=Hymenobacter glaciei TaxID=877209 RepID=A0ABP7TJV9_9BACT